MGQLKYIHVQRVYRTMKKPQRIIDGLIKTGQGGSHGLLLGLLNSRGREHSRKLTRLRGRGLSQ